MRFPFPPLLEFRFYQPMEKYQKVNKFQLQLAAQSLIQRKVKALQYQQLTAFKISYYLEVGGIAPLEIFLLMSDQTEPLHFILTMIHRNRPPFKRHIHFYI